MIKVLAVLTAVLASFLVPGLAHADSTYEVSGTWTLAEEGGQPTIRPKPEDDTLNVTCRNGDHMKDYKVSDKGLVVDSWKRVDGTGVQVQPKFTKVGQTLTVTATCES
jgi:hypothetical protein